MPAAKPMFSKLEKVMLTGLVAMCVSAVALTASLLVWTAIGWDDGVVVTAIKATGGMFAGSSLVALVATVSQGVVDWIAEGMEDE